jgi:hypothetical protein
MKVDPSTTLRARSLKLNGERFGELNTETRSTQRSETGTDLETEAGLAASMEDGSMDFDYCQGTVLWFYHSNVRRGSGVVGRSWREFASLVRQFTSSLSPSPSRRGPKGSFAV